MNRQFGFTEFEIEPTRAVRIRNAHAVADSAIARVADSAERAVPGWAKAALELVRVFARNQDGLFTIEQCRWVVQRQIDAPPDLRAWGVVTRMASARGFIERTNRSAPAYSSNGSDRPLYRRGDKA